MARKKGVPNPRRLKKLEKQDELDNHARAQLEQLVAVSQVPPQPISPPRNAPLSPHGPTFAYFGSSRAALTSAPLHPGGWRTAPSNVPPPPMPLRPAPAPGKFQRFAHDTTSSQLHQVLLPNAQPPKQQTEPRALRQHSSLQPHPGAQPGFEHHLKPPKLPPGLDLWAEVYVPAWLRDVNDSRPLSIVKRSPQEAAWINYESLLDSLWPRQLHRQLLALESVHRSKVSASLIRIEPPASVATARPSARIIPLKPGQPRPVDPSLSETPVTPPAPFSLEDQLRTKLPELTPANYAAYWVPLQMCELQARIKQLQQARLYNVPIRRVIDRQAQPGDPTLYILQARSIREGWPPVDLGDMLDLRQLRPEAHHWQGLLFEASVWGINRAKGEVILRCDALINYEESMQFNIVWKVQDRIFLHWRRATETLDLALNPTAAVPKAPDGTVIPSIVEKWLFPLPTDERQDQAGAFDKDVQLDPTLNTEQQNAVQSILWGKHEVPFLISGPPGTGKTKTLVEAILQILKTDTLAVRLRQHLNPTEMFRLNSPSRPFAEVRGELLPYCHVENERFMLPATNVLLSKRVVVCSTLDAALLLDARISNHDLSMLQVNLLGTIHPRSRIPLARPHFSHLLVDEAAQATEPDLVCALSIVATDRGFCSPCHVTICGDSKQLGPIIVSPEARAIGLDSSLLERLAEREVYRRHPVARRNRASNPTATWTLGTPFVDLTKNYRSATPILMLPSTLFYNETLEPYAPRSTHESSLHKWSGLPNPGFPILFRGVAGEDLPIDEGASFYNEAEVHFVTSYILQLVGSSTAHGPLKASEVSVISPFREQVWRIRLALRSMGLHDVDVGNVEALQGAENRVVIISTVRSTQLRWLPADRVQSRGLIHEPKRFNVAMTRAKELLIVVGNPNTLTIDPHWLAFYHFCIRNQCYVGDPISRSGSTHLNSSILSRATRSSSTSSRTSSRSSAARKRGTGHSQPNGSAKGGMGYFDAQGKYVVGGDPNGKLDGALESAHSSESPSQTNSDGDEEGQDDEDEDEDGGTDDEDGLEPTTAGVEAVSKLEQAWHAEHGHTVQGQMGQDQDKVQMRRDFDILVGRMIGATFEE
ncbi:hypothetical protein OIV83_003694 [Microbotryomycetes sp. JL201]|nr:hypothetical protein OIV83_003694 [Microbotryomycetes sp. JL201]